MKNIPTHLPTPTLEALQHSQKLLRLIRDEIHAQKGAISFARYMELALYAPGLGYYSAGLPKLGQEGDFVTAPEISPLFARCLARQCKQVLEVIGGGDIFELGGGTGKLAADLLLSLEQQECLPEHYFILEVSADLRARQQALLRAQVPHLFNKLIWLDRWPETPLYGVILANEVLDAMPVHRFYINEQGLQEYHVGWQNEELVWQLQPASSTELIHQVASCNLSTENYASEINLLLPGWISSLRQCLQKGLILLIDYGFPRHEYYHPDRHMGTLMCHYRHHAHIDPLLLVGLQDITAHVDFTAVAENACDADLQVAGFTNQASFLLNCGLLDLMPIHSDNARGQIELSQQVQKLTSPAEMGELFKVIALTCEMDIDLVGFQRRDQRGRL